MTPGQNLPRAAGPDSQRYRRLLAVATAALLWEQLWPRLWPAACVLGTFVALALLDVLPVLPHWLHLSSLLLFAAGFIASLAWAWPGFRKIRHEAARTRLERDNDLRDHPLAALEDRLAGGRGDLLAEALWGRHQQRMAALVRRLKVRLPRPGLARHDPWGMRAAVLLLLAIGLVAARQDAGPRLLRAIDPGLGAGRLPPFVELWITPPAYTGVAPMFFTTGGARSAESGASDTSAAAVRPDIRVPRGSVLLVRAGGVGRAPVLAVDSTHIDFLPLASDTDNRRAWRAETPIGEGNRILVRDGRQTLAEWPIQVIPDSPPIAAFAEPPREEGDGLLLIGYAARDDYGVAELTAVIEAADDRVRAAGDGSAVRVALPLTMPGTSSVSGRGLQDLSDQVLAGVPVKMYLEAKDVAGQTGRGDSIEMVLPERSFMHPVARAVVALRKRLIDPQERRPVADALAEIAARPQEFGNDIVASLALAVAGSRLRLDQSEAAIPTVRDLLWQTALRLELGDVPLAERRVEEARQRLVDALQRGAGQAEIEKLMDELQEALDRYLAAAAAELARRGDTPAPVDRHSRMLHSDDLKNLVEMARQLSRTGGRENAMQMLAQLQRALESIRSGLRSGNAGREFAEAQELMDALHDLSGRQQKLLEQSFQQLRESGDASQRGRRDGQAERQRRGPAPTPRAKESAAEQQQLRTQLGELTLRMEGFLGGIPTPLGEADQAMRGAVEALAQELLGEAVADQSQAADALARAIDAAGQAMAQRLGGMMGLSGTEGANGGGSRDIFGRSPNGQRGFGTGPLAIPDHAELQRAHEILEELRRRAAERFRPRPELDYIDRLLRRF
jgi:uncharacterized protein (TIGR02302 family)